MMTPEEWEKIGDIYHRAIELDPDERTGFLEAECAENPSLRREVESLIEADNRAGDFIGAVALKDAARMLVDESPESLVGQKLSSYLIVKHLGSGGMGEVYLARDSRLGREVAIKTIPRVMSTDAERLRRFEIEARAAASLNHPNIATLYSVEDASGQVFIAMEYVDGQILRDHLLPRGLPLDTFFKWFIPLADAFAHAHEKGIVHRDIKPGNIMITAQGKPKILDFGLARINRNEMDHVQMSTISLTTEGVVLGTPAYMSPEQAEGKNIDHRSDIFSFAVLMYEALTGRRPFPGEGYATLISNILKEEPISIAELRPDAPFMISRMIRKCLSKQPNDRYHTMREVRTILEESKAETESGNPYTSGDYLRRQRLIAGLTNKKGLLAVAGLILLTFVSWWLWRSAGSSGPAVRFSISAPAGQDPSLSEAQISPDGNYLVFATRHSDVSQLYLRPLNQIEARPVPGTDGARRPFFSPDSKWIGFFQGEKTLRKVPLEGGEPLEICDSCRPAFESAWGSDNTIISADTTGLYRISAGGGVPERLTKVDTTRGEVTHQSPQFLPGNRKVLFTIVKRTGSRPAILSLDTKKVDLLQNLDDAGFSHFLPGNQFLPAGHLLFSRSNQLMAVPFNPDNLKTDGKPVPVLGGLFSVPNFKVANNGTLIYLPNSTVDRNMLTWVDQTGIETPLFEKRAKYRSPRLSPDGRNLAVQIGNDIWIYEVLSGRGVRLTFEGENQVPVWAPDGKRIAYASKKNDSWNIIITPIDHSDPPVKLLTSDVRQIPYDWHPNGDLIAFTSLNTSMNTEIMLVSIADRKVTPFIESPYIEDTPRFSPDGRWLAYFSNETGKVEVYVKPFPGPGEKIPVSQGGGMFPVWSGDGNELFYRRGGGLNAVRFDTGRKKTAGIPRTLFEGKYLTGFDIASDSRRFMMVKNEQGSLPSEIHVVLNWTDEMKRTLKNK